MIRKAAAVALLALTLVMGGLYLSSSIEPVPWVPPPLSPLVGPYASNQRLQPLQWWAKSLVGPEAITIGPDGALVAGLKDGRIVKLHVGVDTPELLFNTHGRPLAVAWHPDGRLIICDAHHGLLAMNAAGQVETLATGEGGLPFRFVDDLAIARNGTIYFTDASARNSIERFTEDLLEHQTTGRLLKYVPATQEVTRLADGFAFTNGVTLSGDDSFLVVAETGTYRLWRVWLEGERAGQKELFTDSLPGFPDNVRWSPSRGGFWVAIGSPRNAAIDALSAWPHLRRLIAALPKAIQPKPARHAYVLLVDLNGKPVESFQWQSQDSYSPIACATEHEGYLYLGSFAREGVARFRLPVGATGN